MYRQKFQIVSHRDAFRFASDSLTTQGVSVSDAKIIIEGLVDADPYGVATHGIHRIPIYCQRLELGLTSANPRISVLSPLTY